MASAKLLVVVQPLLLNELAKLAADNPLPRCKNTGAKLGSTVAGGTLASFPALLLRSQAICSTLWALEKMEIK